MLVDFESGVLTLQRRPYVENGEAMTIGNLIATLLAGLSVPANTPGSMRKRRAQLAHKITFASAPIEIEEPDAKLIRELLQESTLAPIFTEQVEAALDGKPNPFAATKPNLSVVPKA